ncbi:MAG: DUF533 domain-containing protein [Xanthomonadales bacterium]|nr:DUF533 domain-containing protein [Xanthomonadales bacterium]
MSESRNRAILTIALFAAFADDAKQESEREEIRRIAEALGDTAPDLRSLYQDVLLQRVSLEGAVAELGDAGEKHLAYEMAVGVCEADGRMSEAERAFLNQLQSLLGMQGDQSEAIEQEAEQMVELSEAAAPGTASSSADAGAANPTPVTGVDDAELDRRILNYSILNGALELLPQSWASMAIIPLQIKMVYRIGRDYGYELDRGHIKDFLATLGVGMTSQYIEQFGRKLIGGLFRAAAGRSMGRLGRSATGMAFSFATTYALGQVAKRYYAGGRTMSTELLKQTYAETLGSARQMQTEFVPQIQQRAENLEMNEVMNMVRK